MALSVTLNGGRIIGRIFTNKGILISVYKLNAEGVELLVVSSQVTQVIYLGRIGAIFLG